MGGVWKGSVDVVNGLRDCDNGIEGKCVSSVERVNLQEEEAQAITAEAGLAQHYGEAQTRYWTCPSFHAPDVQLSHWIVHFQLEC